MEARSRMQQNAGNLMAHDSSGPTRQPAQRVNATNSSTFSFAAQQGTTQQSYDHKAQGSRGKQFTNTPLCSAATRQSYQDSNIFGTKAEGSETVQKSATVVKKTKDRQTNTYARSNVIGTDDAATKMKDGEMHATVKRDQGKWNSSIFAEPKLNPVTRKKLGRADNGRGGLYGDTEGSSSWQKKESFAAAMSVKQETRPPQFDDKPAEDRKMKELYGNSNYKPVGSAKKAAAPPSGQADNMKSRKAAQLQSNLLTHADDSLRAERDAGYDMTGQSKGDIGSAQGGWAAQNNLSKAKNKGGIDTYTQKQNQLGSSVLAQTDYSGYAPLGKGRVDMNNIQAKPDPRRQIAEAQAKNRSKPAQEPKAAVNRLLNPATHNKNAMNVSANDTHTYAPAQAVDEPIRVAPVQAKNANENKKLSALSSSIGGADPNRFYNNKAKGEVLDFDLSGLPESADEISVKRSANVKHVISTELAFDNMKGICRGDGRVKIRLNEGETEAQVVQNFKKAGYIVKSHTEDARKKPVFSAGPKEKAIPGSNSKAGELNKKAF